MSRTVCIARGSSHDIRFSLGEKLGSDAIHSEPVYSYAVCRLQSSNPTLEGVGLAFTLGAGNQLVCGAIDYLLKYVEGKEINELMAGFGATYRAMADDPNFRWLGPHKGVVHLALAAVVNACFDLWAKCRQVPLWKLLIDLTPEEVVALLDLSYYEDVLTREEAVALLVARGAQRCDRTEILNAGYPGYDTSSGWFGYSDDELTENIKRTKDEGFTAFKLKVGNIDPARDVARAGLVREAAGGDAIMMFDANQQWDPVQAIAVCRELKHFNPYWIEEPTHPDDLPAHQKISEKTGVSLAMGEHVPNKIVFKNFIMSGCMSFNQVDAVRVGGVSEFILISLLSGKYNVPVVPHVGDMGQLHQHLVLFNHIAVGLPAVLLEHIPHLEPYFKFPAVVKDARYQTPQEPGAGCDLNAYEP